MLQWLPELLEGKDSPVEIRSMSDPKLSVVLEHAVRFGKTLLLTNAENVDPICMEILKSRYIHKQHAPRAVRIGLKVVEVHQAFRLLLHTTNPRSLTNQIRDCLTVVDLSMSLSGLEGEL